MKETLDGEPVHFRSDKNLGIGRKKPDSRKDLGGLRLHLECRIEGAVWRAKR